MKVTTLQKILTRVNGLQKSFFAMISTFITNIIKKVSYFLYLHLSFNIFLIDRKAYGKAINRC